jgi:hypothetical protein
VTRRIRRLLAAALAVFGVAVTPATACAAPPTAVASLIDARWMSFDTTAPWNWESVERRVTPEFQEFGFRPVDEWRGPRPCQGCGDNPPTAEVKVYAPGVYDDAVARQGRSVDVDGRPGFYVPMGDHAFPDEKDGYYDALLTWQYADDAWATARGMTDMTSGLDRLLELAMALRPDERTPIRVPLTLANVPADMPLISIETEDVPEVDGGRYGTTVSFAPCAYVRKGDDCTRTVQATGAMSVFLWPREGYDHSVDGVSHYVDRTIGGRDGRYEATYRSADVLVGNRLYVRFHASAPGDARFEEVLDSVVWASNPADEATWPAVADWAG